jgi:hypothetical protein
MNTETTAPELLARLPDPVNTWPWVAVAAILLIIAVIAFVARRRAPYGI